MGRRKSTQTTARSKSGAEIEIPKAEALTIEFAEPWKKRLQETIIKNKSNPRRVSMAAGLNPTTVNQLLKSRRSPGIDTIMAIAGVLGVSVHWLLTGQEVRTVGETGDAKPDDSLQKVPVLAWASILSWIDHQGDAEIMRYEMAERISPPAGRFRVEFAGTSMAPLIDDGMILDCSGAVSPEPEDVVIAYVAKMRQCVARRLIPGAYGDDGRPSSGRLMTPNAAWPTLQFDVEAGDRIIAVVFDLIRPLRKMPRLRKA